MEILKERGRLGFVIDALAARAAAYAETTQEADLLRQRVRERAVDLLDLHRGSTEAAQTRNIEVGALIRCPRFAARLAGHFEVLAEVGTLRMLELGAAPPNG
jgi:hypothetical protein